MPAKPYHAPHPEPTDEQLRLAWPFFYGRGGCPDTIEQALAHPLYGRCLRAAASKMARPPMTASHGAAAAAASRLGHCTYVPPTPEPPAAARRHDDSALGRWSCSRPIAEAPLPNRHRSRVGAHDAKRAAANDRDLDNAA